MHRDPADIEIKEDQSTMLDLSGDASFEDPSAESAQFEGPSEDIAQFEDAGDSNAEDLEEVVSWDFGVGLVVYSLSPLVPAIESYF